MQFWESHGRERDYGTHSVPLRPQAGKNALPAAADLSSDSRLQNDPENGATSVVAIASSTTVCCS